MTLKQLEQIKAEIDVFNASDDMHQKNPHTVKYNSIQPEEWCFRIMEVLNCPDDSLVSFTDDYGGKLIVSAEIIKGFVLNEQKETEE